MFYQCFFDFLVFDAFFRNHPKHQKSKKLEENTKKTHFFRPFCCPKVCFFFCVLPVFFLIFWFWMLFPKTSKTSKIKKTRGKHKKNTLFQTVLLPKSVFFVFYLCFFDFLVFCFRKTQKKTHFFRPFCCPKVCFFFCVLPVFFLIFWFLIFFPKPSKTSKIKKTRGKHKKKHTFSDRFAAQKCVFFVFYLCFFLIFWFWMLFPKPSKTSKIKKPEENTKKTHTFGEQLVG